MGVLLLLDYPAMMLNLLYWRLMDNFKAIKECLKQQRHYKFEHQD
ncbi:hypothetical protein SAMN05421636_11311 [Pricia antarctica]|uniref:Uncharacterized protein n=1 Tax=Pricia antarctica TaxID=641691 RepID=A0A1G7IMR1_9FLAO|nr:hypothetical protein SAMN05421636_11311 [Pricia antarctica]